MMIQNVSAGTAGANGDGNTRDVSKPHRRRERSRERLEMGHFARLPRCVIHAAGEIDRMSEPAEIDESHANGQKECSQQQPNHHERNACPDQFLGTKIKEQNLGEVVDDVGSKCFVHLLRPLGLVPGLRLVGCLGRCGWRGIRTCIFGCERRAGRFGRFIA